MLSSQYSGRDGVITVLKCPTATCPVGGNLNEIYTLKELASFKELQQKRGVVSVAGSTEVLTIIAAIYLHVNSTR